MKTYWNGEPTRCEQVTVRVGPSLVDTWWCAVVTAGDEIVEALRPVVAAFTRLATALRPIVDLLAAVFEREQREHRVMRSAIEHHDITAADIRRVDGDAVVLWNGRRIAVDPDHPPVRWTWLAPQTVKVEPKRGKK